jgi:PEP-CTERM motif
MLRPYALTTHCLAACAFALFTMSFSLPAHAIMTLSLDEGSGPTIITDGDDDGKITFDGSLTKFTTNVSTGLSKPKLIGAPTIIDLNSVNISEAAGTLVIELSDTGFTDVTGYLTSAIGGTTNGTVTYETFVDPDNGDPFAATLLAVSTTSDPFFSTGSKVLIDLTGGDPYSVGIRVTIEHGSGTKITSFNSEIRIPEPASLGMLGTGLVLAGLLMKRRRKSRPI